MIGNMRPGVRWTEQALPDRKAWLETRIAEWQVKTSHDDRAGPFEGVELGGADVFWLAARSLAGTSEERAIDEQASVLRQALSDANLRRSLQLDSLNLTGA